MIDRIIEYSVRQRAFVLLAALGLLLAGAFAAIRLPIDAIPDITGIQVQVNSTVPALAAEEVENLVTFPLETSLGGIEGITEMRSLSRFGLSQITLQFTDDTDIYRARQLVAERLQTAAENLPRGVLPELGPITTGLGEVFYYSVDYEKNAPNLPPTREAQLMQLYEAQEYIIKPHLRSVPGIADINTYGGFVKQFVVQPDIEKLRAAGLTVSDLAEVVSANAENAGGGIVNAGVEQLVIRGVSRVTDTNQIADLPVKFAAGAQPLRVRDVAAIEIGRAQRVGAATDNGVEAVLGVAMMLMGENSRAVSLRVADKVTAIQKLLPPGMVIKSQYNRSDLVDRMIRTVETNLFEGAALVIAMLLILLGNWRASLIVAAAIPLSFLFAITGMERFGISGNLMSLGAIDFGLITDGAVVMVENIVRQLAHRQRSLNRALTREERLATVVAASKQVGSPMFFGVLIITVVYAPILSLGGIEGKMFHPMALTVMLALGGSLAVAVAVMPALCATFLRGKISESESLVMRALKSAYAPVLHFALRQRWLVIAASALLFIASLLVFNRLGANFIPTLDEGAYTMMVFRTNSISVDATVQAQTMTDREIRARIPEVTAVFSRIGSAEIATDPMPPSDADFYIFHKPRSEWRKIGGQTISKPELTKIITTEIERLNPGAYVMVAQPIEMRFNEMLEGIRADIAVKIFGRDYDELDRLGAEVKEVLEKIPGSREGEGEIEFETMGRSPMLEIRLKRDVLAKYNLHAADANKVIADAIAGASAGQLLDGNRRYEIVVRIAEADRENIAKLKTLPVRVGEFGMLPLGAIADFERVSGVSPIMRDSGQRRSALMIDLEDRDVQSWVQEAQEKVSAAVKLPEGYSIEFGGQFENLVAAKARLAVIVPVALLVIFVLIFAAFGSLPQAALVFSGVPLAVTGGVFALWLRDMPFSITAAVGFIALSGVAVLNGVVLLSYFNELRRQGKDVLTSVTEGSLARLRPVLMTASLAAFGFLPMALATGPGAEVQRPLATVVIGGIISSTFLTLALLPTLYLWIESRSSKAASASHAPI